MWTALSLHNWPPFTGLCWLRLRSVVGDPFIVDITEAGSISFFGSDMGLHRLMPRDDLAEYDWHSVPIIVAKPEEQ